MTKILKVIKPFYVMETGDTFEFDNNTNQYKSVYEEEHNSSNDENSSVFSSYSSTYAISEEYAKMLIDNGYLADISGDTKKDPEFVNVFTEISDLTEKYNDELERLLTEENDAPQCLKVEKETVLRNMIKLLSHLASLKK